MQKSFYNKSGFSLQSDWIIFCHPVMKYIHWDEAREVSCSNTLSSLINEHARLLTSRRNSILPYVIRMWPFYRPTRLLNLKKKIQPTRLFQPTRLLETWEYASTTHNSTLQTHASDCLNALNAIPSFYLSPNRAKAFLESFHNLHTFPISHDIFSGFS